MSKSNDTTKTRELTGAKLTAVAASRISHSASREGTKRLRPKDGGTTKRLRPKDLGTRIVASPVDADLGAALVLGHEPVWHVAERVTQPTLPLW